MPRKRIRGLKSQTKTKKKKAGYLQSVALDFKLLGVGPEVGTFGLESSALTTRPRRPGANLRRDPTSHVLFLNQSVLADFDDRKKKIRISRLVVFQARVIKVLNVINVLNVMPFSLNRNVVW